MDFESIKTFLDNPFVQASTVGGFYGLLGGTMAYGIEKLMKVPKYPTKNLLKVGLNFTILWDVFNTIIGVPVADSLMADPAFYGGFIGGYIVIESLADYFKKTIFPSEPPERYD